MANTLATIFGIILVLLGLLGFVSNPLIGADALFAADATLNVIHIVLGAVLLAGTYWSSDASRWLKTVGVIAFLLGLLGVFMLPATGGTLLGLFEANTATAWLHLVAGAAIFVAGTYGAPRRSESQSDTATGMPQA